MIDPKQYTYTVPATLQPVIDILHQTPLGKISSPWRYLGELAVGTLEAVGFDPSSERLLIVSGNGQSVVDAATGTILHRDHKRSNYDPKTLRAWPTNKEEAGSVRMSGRDGGGLRSKTDDGWSVDILPIAWPQSFYILNHPGSDIYLAKIGYPVRVNLLVKDHGCRAFGFSWTGNTLIWADAAGLKIWGR